jgi:hypothetical protein
VPDSDVWPARARAAAATSDDDAAKAEYLALISHDPTHLAALLELAAPAERTGHRSAAQTAYHHAVTLVPDNQLSRTGPANLLRDSGETATAEANDRAALADHTAFPPAHQGLAQLPTALDDPRAEFHWQAGFAENAVVRRPYRGTGTGIPVLMLVAAREGDVPTGQWIDNRRHAVTEICADFADPGAELPPHRLLINAIGDVDACAEALAARIVWSSAAKPPSTTIRRG